MPPEDKQEAAKRGDVPTGSEPADGARQSLCSEYLADMTNASKLGGCVDQKMAEAGTASDRAFASLDAAGRDLMRAANSLLEQATRPGSDLRMRYGWTMYFDTIAMPFKRMSEELDKALK